MNDKIGFDIIDKGFQKDLEKERIRLRTILEEEIKSGKNPKFSQSHTDWMLAKFPYAHQDQRSKAVSAEMEKRRRQQEAFDTEVEKRLSEQKTILERLHFGEKGRQFAFDQAQREEKIKAFKEKQREKQEQEKKLRHQTTEQSKAKGEILTKEQQGKFAGEQDNAKQHTLNADFNSAANEGSAAIDAKIKVEQFKERQRQRAKSGKDREQSKTQGDREAKPERTSPSVTDDFNIAHSTQEIDGWHDRKPELRSNIDSGLIHDSDIEISSGENGSSNDLTATSSSVKSKEETFKAEMRERFNSNAQEQSSDLEPEM